MTLVEFNDENAQKVYDFYNNLSTDMSTEYYLNHNYFLDTVASMGMGFSALKFVKRVIIDDDEKKVLKKLNESAKVFPNLEQLKDYLVNEDDEEYVNKIVAFNKLLQQLYKIAIEAEKENLNWQDREFRDNSEVNSLIEKATNLVTKYMASYS
ncbi:hypothetical protein [Lactobacillus intestinalis]|uniref:hypothetical protein n=1 Tax=Lactobacillus intestinalis TaxID=151781 RepID=UPI00266EE516|nr:hypothetical protein [Lactobacillus intestinalis]